jgi:hypothetical protein
MNLTRIHLPLLRDARELIESEKEFFICYALAHANYLDALFNACRDHITEGIQDEPYLTDWVREQVREPVWWLHEDATRYCAPRREEAVTQLRLMRLTWLDKIIHDIEAQHAE